MKNFDMLYDVAEGNFGLVTFSEAKSMGISIRELDRWLKNGWLERAARGLYRVSRFPSSECDPYAIAVESVGYDAFLHGESVLALLHLAPTNPTWIYVASPRRVRRKVGEGIIVVQGVPAGKSTNYLGVRSQSLADALLACGSTVRADRRLRAAEEGLRQGYLDNEEFARVNKEIRHGQASA
jgi:predicted transcriptional regulator of viral defense system